MDKPYLIGSKCSICGYVCFPKKEACVRCRKKGVMQEIKLGPSGILENFAVLQVGLPDLPSPYIIGYIRTKEGALIFSRIANCPATDDALEIGEKMELIIEEIKDDEEGNSRVRWKFKPTRKVNYEKI